MPNPSVRSIAGSANFGSTAVGLLPPTVSAGDSLYLAVCISNETATTPSTPSGWSLLASVMFVNGSLQNSPGLYLYGKNSPATGSEGGTTVNVTVPACDWAILSASVANGGTPVLFGTANAHANSVTTGSITPVAGSAGLAFGALQDPAATSSGTITWPGSPWTSGTNEQSQSSTCIAGRMAYQNNLSATGTTVTATNGANQWAVALLMAVPPVGGSSPPPPTPLPIIAGPRRPTVIFYPESVAPPPPPLRQVLIARPPDPPLEEGRTWNTAARADPPPLTVTPVVRYGRPLDPPLEEGRAMMWNARSSPPPQTPILGVMARPLDPPLGEGRTTFIRPISDLKVIGSAHFISAVGEGRPLDPGGAFIQRVNFDPYAPGPHFPPLVARPLDPPPADGSAILARAGGPNQSSPVRLIVARQPDQLADPPPAIIVHGGPGPVVRTIPIVAYSESSFEPARAFIYGGGPVTSNPRTGGLLIARPIEFPLADGYALARAGEISLPRPTPTVIARSPDESVQPPPIVQSSIRSGVPLPTVRPPSQLVARPIEVMPDASPAYIRTPVYGGSPFSRPATIIARPQDLTSVDGVATVQAGRSTVARSPRILIARDIDPPLADGHVEFARAGGPNRSSPIPTLVARPIEMPAEPGRSFVMSGPVRLFFPPAPILIARPLDPPMESGSALVSTGRFPPVVVRPPILVAAPPWEVFEPGRAMIFGGPGTFTQLTGLRVLLTGYDQSVITLTSLDLDIDTGD